MRLTPNNWNAEFTEVLPSFVFKLNSARVADTLINNIMAGNSVEKITTDIMSLLPLADQNPTTQSNVMQFVEKAILTLGKTEEIEISSDGFIKDKKIIKEQFTNLEYGELKNINAIVLHRTDSPKAKDTLNYYKTAKYGAHFLIDTDGTIYQTASLKQKTKHVGPIRSKCFQEDTCADDEKNTILSMEKKIKKTPGMPLKIHMHEMKKSYPHRYPTNSDSIGIEVVGKYDSEKGYVESTLQQRESLKFLIEKLKVHYKIENDDIYPHTDISRKDNKLTEGKFLGY